MDCKLPGDIEETVARALAEDIGDGDLTAALVPAAARAEARLTVREDAVLCGTAWFDAVFHQLDRTIDLRWSAADGDAVSAGDALCVLQGAARPILTGERTALNFLQLLSGTATEAARWVQAVAGTGTRVLDTRKTVPGLRRAQKYAVCCGGCDNHRLGLWDGILIKENHIAVAGGIGAAVAAVKNRGAKAPLPQAPLPQAPLQQSATPTIEVEVENLDELDAAIAAGADIALLDNFDLDQLGAAVRRVNGRIRLEASGNVSLATLPAIAATGVDFVSVGALTKQVQAVDLSLRVVYKEG